VAAVGLVIFAALVGLLIYARFTTAPAAPPTQPTTSAVVTAITSLDLNQSTGVGAGGVNNPFKPIHGAPPLTGASGRPAVLYIGAEYCPYCAAERWSLVVALSRFGTFSGLQLTQSSSTDIYPNTPTLTFAKAAYQSSTIDFQAVETEDRNQQPLQQPTQAQIKLLQTYDASGSIPFVDIANQQYEVGAGYLPDNLQGKTWQQVADSLQDPGSPIARQVLGNANWITAAVCQATGDSAGSACSAPGIKALEARLGA
jgi:thiol-disulfide isomerase/thioredoxin